MTRAITLHEATRSIARYLREVKAGTEFVITRNGTPASHRSANAEC
jgi:prevent-host-death family protein